MNLHEAPGIYLELIQATAADRGIPAIYVEKDYWVTRVLKRLSESDHREAVVFKGGTSLSKAHGVIERFSEDIDLAIRGGNSSPSDCLTVIAPGRSLRPRAMIGTLRNLSVG